jgi:hypothetical protein
MLLRHLVPFNQSLPVAFPTCRFAGSAICRKFIALKATKEIFQVTEGRMIPIPVACLC